jgi:hypothetical protein
VSATITIFDDETKHWLVFRRTDAIGDFATWAEADAIRETDKPETDDAPVWTPKSGGY